MDARTEPEAERELARVIRVDGELYRVCGRSTDATFRDLNRCRAALGKPPVQSASSPVLSTREERDSDARQIRGWRSQHALAAVPAGHEASCRRR